MKLTKDQHIKISKVVSESVMHANWGIRGIARVFEKQGLEGCELTTQTVCDLHCAILSLSQRIDEQLEWFTMAEVKS